MAILRTFQAGQSDPTLRGPDVRLRPPQLRDWQAWAELRAASRDFLTPWEPTWPSDALTRSAYRRRIRRQIRDASDDIGYAFFVMRESDDALLGGITLSNVQRGAAQSCSVGYWVGKPHAGRGYMTQALTCTLVHCFNTLGVNRVEAACMPNNRASQKLLERCGFRREGYARNYLRINGAWRDHLLFAVLVDHWKAPAGWPGQPRGNGSRR